MRILHLMLSCFYIDNANYQENVIPRQNKKDGHEVLIIASTEVFIKNNILGLTFHGSYINEDGIPVTRLPYNRIVNKLISTKVRSYPNLYKLIAGFAPDVILFHGTAAYALITVTEYKKNNPLVRFYVDSHEDYHNSATNYLSKQILHKIFYKQIIQYCLPYIDKILYITYETLIFLKDAYGIPEHYLQFFPLGGTIPEFEKRESVRNKIRSELKIGEDQILIIHSGKLDAKKRTSEIVNAFREVTNKNLRLLIIGSMDDAVSESTIPIIEADPRIHYLGWVNSSLLQDYLCAGDLYVQLGGQSATMQNAICCGCAAAIYPYESHKFLLKDSVFYINNTDDLIDVLKMVSTDRTILEEKRKISFNIAETILDYKIISAMIYKNITTQNSQ
jgi:glycosyltransferase involved in cell wall biosynthesis